jgi:hypothetical protein
MGFIMTCPTCATDPCVNSGFCRACRDADARKARGEQPRFIDASSWRGLPDHEEAATKRRISELAEQQLHEVCGRLQRLMVHHNGPSKH